MLIPDENLGYVVSRTLRVKPHELTPELMTKITRLEAPNHEIRSLEGLQFAENLEYMDVSNNQIETLDPIRDLRNLEILDASSNQLRDIQALHGFRQLRKLNISRNNLYTMDVSSIAAMIDLESLNLEKAKVDSLEYLERCKKLQEVSINTENGPFSYAILGTLKQLKKLNMRGMRLFNIEDLTYLSSVEVLDLSTNLMSDLSPLLSMESLTELNLSNCPYISDYSVLTQFPNLSQTGFPDGRSGYDPDSLQGCGDGVQQHQKGHDREQGRAEQPDLDPDLRISQQAGNQDSLREDPERPRPVVPPCADHSAGGDRPQRHRRLDGPASGYRGGNEAFERDFRHLLQERRAGRSADQRSSCGGAGCRISQSGRWESPAKRPCPKSARR